MIEKGTSPVQDLVKQARSLRARLINFYCEEMSTRQQGGLGSLSDRQRAGFEEPIVAAGVLLTGLEEYQHALQRLPDAGGYLMDKVWTIAWAEIRAALMLAAWTAPPAMPAWWDSSGSDDVSGSGLPPFTGPLEARMREIAREELARDAVPQWPPTVRDNS